MRLATDNYVTYVKMSWASMELWCMETISDLLVRLLLPFNLTCILAHTLVYCSQDFTLFDHNKNTNIQIFHHVFPRKQFKKHQILKKFVKSIWNLITRNFEILWHQKNIMEGVA